MTAFIAEFWPHILTIAAILWLVFWVGTSSGGY
jgi:hypothetical protein